MKPTQTRFILASFLFLRRSRIDLLEDPGSTIKMNLSRVEGIIHSCDLIVDSMRIYIFTLVRERVCVLSGEKKERKKSRLEN